MDWLAPLMAVLLASPVLVVVSLFGRRLLDDARPGQMRGRLQVPVSQSGKQGGALLASIYVASWLPR